MALAGLFEPVLGGVARTVDESRLGEPVRRHVAQLRPLGALRPAGPAERLPHHENPDLLLVVRTTGTLAGLVEVARETKVPHLLLDLAYHHTAAVGPFVVPGAGACLAPRPAATSCEFPISLALQAVQNIRGGSVAGEGGVVTGLIVGVLHLGGALVLGLRLLRHHRRTR